MDLGRAFAVSVRRQPGAEAIVEGERRRTYAAWYEEIKAVAGGLTEMGLKAGDHLVVVMRNRYEMATLYWACHLIGVIFTPVSWRASAEEIRYCLEDAEAAAVAFDGASGSAAAEAAAALEHRSADRVIVAADGKGDGRAFARLLEARARRRSRRGERVLHLPDALHLRHHRPAQGRAAQPPQRADRVDLAYRAEPVPPRRLVPGRDAAVPYDGRAPAARARRCSTAGSCAWPTIRPRRSCGWWPPSG